MLKQIFSYRMLIVLLMGYAGGLPLLLVGSTLQAWMTESGVDLSTIGWFASLSLAYTLKFLWAPLMDRFPLWPSRRRGWMALTQLFLVISIWFLSTLDPAANLTLVAITAAIIAFFSASQDITIDAYRREILSDEELGLGSSLYVIGYRLALLVAGALALWLADGRVSWPVVYKIMASCMGVGLIITLIAPKEDDKISAPKSIQEAVIGPFMEFIQRDGAWVILAFILLYKAGDTMAANMTTPFMLLKGYTKTDIATVVKGFGLASMIAGGLLGGLFTMRLGTLKALWIFGFLQSISTAGFCWLSVADVSLTNLSIVIAFENLSAGLGTSAYSAFMASMTNKKFTATQYALLTALMAVPRVLLAGPTGWMAEVMGWNGFFLLCTFIAIPGMAMIPILTKKSANADHNPSAA
ncbi:MAG: AmpG family muropeptide MFS transporter [Bacteriovoracaceae bacterium]|nr:AmpG family muropeptide MFS transporter [Bacteriovoracaceae bacterium]